jgi:hypothetical protein
MFVTAVSEISHTGQVKVRLSSGLMRVIHIGDPHFGQVGRSLGSGFGGVFWTCVMALPFSRERGSVSQSPTPTDSALAILLMSCA